MRLHLCAAALILVWLSNPYVHAQTGQAIGNDPDGVIYDVDLATGQASNPRLTGIPFLVDVAADEDGEVFGLTTFFTPPENSVVRIDPYTGQWTLVGATGLSDIREGDLAIHPTTGRIYGIQFLESTSGDLFLFEIDRATGAASSLVEIASPGDLSAMTFDVTGALLVLDTDLELLLTIDPTTGDVTDSVALSVPLGRGAGMDIERSTGTIFVADGGDLGTDTLYTLEPATGVLTGVGPLGLPDGLSGLTFLYLSVFSDDFETGDTSRWSATLP